MHYLFLVVLFVSLACTKPSATPAAPKTVLDEAREHQDGLFLASCYRAESFLASWQESLPFGRPLAS